MMIIVYNGEHVPRVVYPWTGGQGTIVRVKKTTMICTSATTPRLSAYRKVINCLLVWCFSLEEFPPLQVLGLWNFLGCLGFLKNYFLIGINYLGLCNLAEPWVEYQKNVYHNKHECRYTNITPPLKKKICKYVYLWLNWKI